MVGVGDLNSMLLTCAHPPQGLFSPHVLDFYLEEIRKIEKCSFEWKMTIGAIFASTMTIFTHLGVI